MHAATLSHRFLTYLCLTAWMCHLASCRSTRQTLPVDTRSSYYKTFSQALDQRPDYKTVQAKVKFSTEKANLNGKLSVSTDEAFCLLVNAPVFGFEIGRVEAVADTLFLVDKYDKQYTTLCLSDLYHVDEVSGKELDALECLFLGRVFLPKVGKATAKDYLRLTWATESDSLHMGQMRYTATYNADDFTLQYTFSATGQLQQTAFFMGKKAIQWQYAQYQEVSTGKYLPSKAVLTATRDDGEALSLSLDISNYKLNNGVLARLNLSNGFQPVDFESLAATLKKLAK